MGDGAVATGGGHYGVKLVRGPFVRLPAHAEACADEEAFLSYAARLRAAGAHLAADLFSGGGRPEPRAWRLPGTGWCWPPTVIPRRSRRTGITSAA